MKIWGNPLAGKGSRLVVLSILMATFAGSVNSAPAAESALENWIQLQAKRSLERINLSISPRDGAVGAIMASPSRSHPDYYAYWVRDGSLVMREVWNFRLFGLRDARNQMKDFAYFSRENQETPNWSGAPYDLGIGEPKFEITGKPYNKGWGRPQNDGPALRVLALLGYANDLMKNGKGEFVKSVLYNPVLPARTVIKADLEFVAHHWKDTSFDLWEEIRGDHFYTRIAQWRALDEGAEFARKMGDAAAGNFYDAQAKQVQNSLNAFWSPSKGYIGATRNQTGGVNDKHSNLDIAIILGVLHSAKPGHPFSVSDERVIATMYALEQTFDRIYNINRVTKNREGFPMAPGLGRYPEDRYDGYTTDKAGNPWFLATHGAAEYLLRLRGEIKKSGTVRVTDITRPFYESLLKKNLRPKTKGMKIAIRRDDANFDEVLKALAARSDAYIRRSQYHTDNGHQSEQFNRNNGFMQGAVDLTWSYASFLSYYRTREQNYE